MATAQQLLVRAAISSFWRQPRTEPLERWNNRLHDRWMLPRYLDMDIAEVCRDLAASGIPMQEHWFAPHSQFRMPTLGNFTVDGVEVTLRQALEPWHVLGEESTSGGQARYVDSSCERVEVLVRGISDRRHQLLCNGYAVPLQPTGIEGEMVAGVRYRAWQPPSCLHPTIPIDTPLTFDLYDHRYERSLGGAQYHVMHPGGRSFETRPINALEAEGRRCQRFQQSGHRGGLQPIKRLPTIPEAPHTLDLRHQHGVIHP